MTNWYMDWCSSLTGGGDGALDAIDGTSVADGCVALVVTSSGFYAYQLDEDSAAAESSPTVIKPDSNAGNKRWILREDAVMGALITALAARVTAIEGHYDSYIDRGDHAVDVDQTNMTTDGSWHDMNLGGIVPAGAKAIVLQVYIQNAGAGNAVQFRKKGSSASNTPTIRSQVANVPNDAQLVVFCDSSRYIQYAAANGVWASINITVAGWFI